jgi:hypothetical protein
VESSTVPRIAADSLSVARLIRSITDLVRSFCTASGRTAASHQFAAL